MTSEAAPSLCPEPERMMLRTKGGGQCGRCGYCKVLRRAEMGEAHWRDTPVGHLTALGLLRELTKEAA